MSAKVKTLDVWLVESNVVYRDVPFTAVIDWVQQGRLLEEDQLRPSGTEKWIRLSSSKTMAAYLPREEPQRVEDQAEALEPVAVDFSWKKPHFDDDDDVDMIPLIDISLVLLVFFMMTASVIVSSNQIDVPATSNSFIANSADTYWIGIDRIVDKEGNERPPAYSYGEGEKPPDPDNMNLTEAEVVNRLATALRLKNMLVDVRIAADRRLPAEIVMNMTAALEPLRQGREKYIRDIRAEVNERRQ
jgi:biopolymer transport protein ExbD